MEEGRLKKLVAAGTATGVIVLFILIGVMVYQLVSMGTKKREAERLQAEITELKKDIAAGEDEIDTWLKKWKIEERARQKGYIYKTNDDD
mgnify:FL=1